MFLRCIVFISSKNQGWLAKKSCTLWYLRGIIAKQYKRLYDYGGKIMRSNPSSNVKISVIYLIIIAWQDIEFSFANRWNNSLIVNYTAFIKIIEIKRTH